MIIKLAILPICDNEKKINTEVSCKQNCFDFYFSTFNEMKKVNKQCLLDTNRTVRKKEKLPFWQVIVQTSRP